VVTGRYADNVSKVSQECEKVSPNGLKAFEVVADLIKEEDCKRLIDLTISEFGKLDILVNNAGLGCGHTYQRHLNYGLIRTLYET
jgi:NADP-dependent 3-hydroxy acid dehydrogenase YdfG